MCFSPTVSQLGKEDDTPPPQVWLGMALSAETLRATPRLLLGILPKDFCRLQLTNLHSTCPSDKEISLLSLRCVFCPMCQQCGGHTPSQPGTGTAVATHADFVSS